jgi:hypothetical protein
MRKLVGLGIAHSIPPNLNAGTLFVKKKNYEGEKNYDKMGCLPLALSLTSSAIQRKKNKNK